MTELEPGVRRSELHRIVSDRQVKDFRVGSGQRQNFDPVRSRCGTL